MLQATLRLNNYYLFDTKVVDILDIYIYLFKHFWYSECFLQRFIVLMIILVKIIFLRIFEVLKEIRIEYKYKKKLTTKT